MEEKTAATSAVPATPTSARQTAPAKGPSSAQPVMDVRPAPPPEKTGEKTKDDKPAQPSASAPPKPARPRQPGVGMAITATVIIVLGLAALATFAYLKT